MRRRTLIIVTIAFASIIGFGWNLTARAAYESAPYKVLKKDGDIEIREYPDLLLAATGSKVSTNGKDGSFMKLFRYISGSNEANQKIEMTTPVFMEDGVNSPNALMGFVMPKSVAQAGAPQPTGAGVVLHNREGGKFAVIRFSGRMNEKLASKQEAILRSWIAKNGLTASERADTAGYDPPFTPGMFRRNEVLIPLIDPDSSETSSESPTSDGSQTDAPSENRP